MEQPDREQLRDSEPGSAEGTVHFPAGGSLGTVCGLTFLAGQGFQREAMSGLSPV